MELTGLTKDAKYLLAKELPSKDLVALCSTNTEMRQLCMSEKFNPIWLQRLKTEYNIDHKGSDGYREFMLNTYCFNRTYWAATFYDTNDETVHEIILTRTKEEAFAKILETINNSMDFYNIQVSYVQLKAGFEYTEKLRFDALQIMLQTAHFDLSPTINYEEIYQAKLNDIVLRLFPGDEERQKDFLDDFPDMINDFIDNDIQPTGVSIIERLIDRGEIENEPSPEVYQLLDSLLSLK